jgi:hypothetical protein
VSLHMVSTTSHARAAVVATIAMVAAVVIAGIWPSPAAVPPAPVMPRLSPTHAILYHPTPAATPAATNRAPRQRIGDAINGDAGTTAGDGVVVTATKQ